jgi:hypothetical protein
MGVAVSVQQVAQSALIKRSNRAPGVGCPSLLQDDWARASVVASNKVDRSEQRNLRCTWHLNRGGFIIRRLSTMG